MTSLVQEENSTSFRNFTPLFHAAYQEVTHSLFPPISRGSRSIISLRFVEFEFFHVKMKQLLPNIY
jgi:hypothetical protein